ncbi:Similar to Suppressor of kinetochore protein 1; acc. no. Q9Y709 [Pyronema omphalodes CBS 100304]|uniref:Similar to Suppressor of kinetochore protein 1 acc. no. Q9Y709 n=1 Tax=Pyronema omphalodes (strain CBS 100304) TaxID=1076935 RepID=U4LS45_PYROM|nr:Similar to Suppressor of kinetochore protein 1; acc. no. Q9Y709 [Pyronema omphalodes CBS 100304]
MGREVGPGIEVLMNYDFITGRQMEPHNVVDIPLEEEIKNGLQFQDDWHNNPWQPDIKYHRCIHRRLAPSLAELDPDMNRLPNFVLTGGKASLKFSGWCRYHTQGYGTSVVKETDLLWDNDDITEFDRDFMDTLEHEVDNDLVFELITATYKLQIRPLNIFVWKVLLNMYKGMPADPALKRFLQYLDLGIETPLDNTDEWLESTISKVILPKLDEQNNGREFIPVSVTIMWDILGVKKEDWPEHRPERDAATRSAVAKIVEMPKYRPRHDEL